MAHAIYSTKAPPGDDDIRSMIRASHDTKSASEGVDIMSNFTKWYGVRKDLGVY